MKFFILVKRNLKVNNDPSVQNMFLKWLWVPQAKQLIKLFKADLTQLVNGLIKINKEFQVDFSFIDKVIANIVGIDRNLLQNALSNIETNSAKKRNTSSRKRQQDLQ